jgi:hypothetical protein
MSEHDRTEKREGHQRGARGWRWRECRVGMSEQAPPTVKVEQGVGSEVMPTQAEWRDAIKSGSGRGVGIKSVRHTTDIILIQLSRTGTGLDSCGSGRLGLR